MSVVILSTRHTWRLNSPKDHCDYIESDGLCSGPTYISIDHNYVSSEVPQIFNFLRADKISNNLWKTNFPPASVISQYYAYGYKLISQAGCGSGFSGGKYDPTATDHRWSWTLIREG